MFDGGDNEKYIKYIMSHDCLGKEKGLDVKIHDCVKAAVAVLRTVKKLRLVLSLESRKANEERVLELLSAKEKFKKTQ